MLELGVGLGVGNRLALGEGVVEDCNKPESMLESIVLGMFQGMMAEEEGVVAEGEGEECSSWCHIWGNICMVCGKVKDIPENRRKTLLSQLTTTLYWISNQSFLSSLSFVSFKNNSVTFSLSRGFSFFGCCSYSAPVTPCTLLFFPLLPLTFARSKQYIALALQIIKGIDTVISYRTTIFFCHTLGGRSFCAASPKLWLIAYRFHASIFFRKNRWDLFNLIMDTSQLLQLQEKKFRFLRDSTP